MQRAKGLNDPLKFIDNSEVDVEVDDTDERQQKANDMMDAAQSMMNDIVDDLQGKVDDMEVANG